MAYRRLQSRVAIGLGGDFEARASIPAAATAATAGGDERHHYDRGDDCKYADRDQRVSVERHCFLLSLEGEWIARSCRVSGIRMHADAGFTRAVRDLRQLADGRRSADDGFANAERDQDFLGDGLAREPDFLAEKRGLAVS